MDNEGSAAKELPAKEVKLYQRFRQFDKNVVQRAAAKHIFVFSLNQCMNVVNVAFVYTQ